MNNWLFKHGENPFEVWNPQQPDSQREETERDIRIAIKEAFLEEMHYVEQQGLKETAIKLVVGSSHKISEEERNLLLNYQFILAVPNKEKREIFGYNLGPTTADTMKRYICFSALTSHIMKDIYDPDIDGYDLLKTTELRLRDMVSIYLSSLCTSPFKMSAEGHEQWEEYHLNKIRLSPKDEKTLIKSLDEMYDVRMKREQNDCKPSFDRSLINMVTSATLGQLWYVFIKWLWREYFSEILDPQNASHKDRELWYSTVYRVILDWRNAANHYYEEELSDDFLERAKNIAQELVRDLSRWMETER